MPDSRIRRHRVAIVIGVAAICVWTALGALDARDRGFFDPLFDPDYVMRHAPQGGTLDVAGFRQGDSVVSVAGIPVTELGMYSRWPRSLSRRPGESLTMTVVRGGESVTGEIVFVERSSGAGLRLGGAAIVFCFIGCGLWAVFVVPTRHAVRLAYAGLVLGAAMPGPYLGSWDGVATHFQAAMIVLWTILMLRFFLLFPEPKRLAENRLTTGLTYGVWGALLLTMVVELVFHPRFYHTFAPLNGLLLFVFSAFAVAAVVHTSVKTSRVLLWRSGMGLILVGVAVAFGLTLVAVIDRAFLWSVDIPGSGFFPLAIAAIPLAMAIAVRKQGISAPK